jgi:hypothetical protein
MGFIADLHLEGNDISNAASAFYLAVLVAVIPTGLSHPSPPYTIAQLTIFHSVLSAAVSHCRLACVVSIL